MATNLPSKPKDGTPQKHNVFLQDDKYGVRNSCLSMSKEFLILEHKLATRERFRPHTLLKPIRLLNRIRRNMVSSDAISSTSYSLTTAPPFEHSPPLYKLILPLLVVHLTNESQLTNLKSPSLARTRARALQEFLYFHFHNLHIQPS